MSLHLQQHDGSRVTRGHPSRTPRVANEQGTTLPFRITTRRPVAGTVVIQVVGEIDLLTASWLDAEITDQLRTGARILILDLGEVTFLSGSALRALLSAREAAARSNTWLSLVYRSITVQRPLVALHLTGLFHTATDVFQALAQAAPALSGRQRRQRDATQNARARRRSGGGSDGQPALGPPRRHPPACQVIATPSREPTP